MAQFVILPVPFEKTTTYGKGTKKGPAAILAASQQIETFDEELLQETYKLAGIRVAKPVKVFGLKSLVVGLLNAGKTPVVLGGEHSITPLVVSAFAQKYQNLSVLQLDAHADLRDSYQGSKNSHACAMRRTLEICPVVQAGIRNIAKEEYNFAKSCGQLTKVHFAAKLAPIKKILSQLSRHVYITIDVDVFDPSLVPATGTPEPGGLFWDQVLDILRAVCAKKKVVGFDVVELAPIKGLPASDFTAAKLIYRLMGYLAKQPFFGLPH
ncbi:MAG: agmatinase [Candidatus Margulisbacteria bacterium]|nr:agmatinase [Candidatus Margulisiibacteriota bacterium]